MIDRWISIIGRIRWWWIRRGKGAGLRSGAQGGIWRCVANATRVFYRCWLWHLDFIRVVKTIIVRRFSKVFRMGFEKALGKFGWDVDPGISSLSSSAKVNPCLPRTSCDIPLKNRVPRVECVKLSDSWTDLPDRWSSSPFRVKHCNEDVVELKRDR